MQLLRECTLLSSAAWLQVHSASAQARPLNPEATREPLHSTLLVALRLLQAMQARVLYKPHLPLIKSDSAGLGVGLAASSCLTSCSKLACSVGSSASWALLSLRQLHEQNSGTAGLSYAPCAVYSAASIACDDRECISAIAGMGMCAVLCWASVRCLCRTW